MKKLSLLMVMIFGIMAGVYAQTSVVTFTVTQAPCANDGIITGSWTGGTAPYSLTYYFWNGTQVVHAGVTSTSDALTGWDGTGFSVMITDANGFSNDGGHGPEYPFEVSNMVSPIVCPTTDGSITTTVTGGTAPYTYEYYNENDLSTVVSNTNPAVITDAGSYVVRVTDANGCMVTSATSSNGQQGDSLYVGETAPFEFNVVKTPANCTNGTATPGPVSGSSVPPYSYLWSNGSTSATGISGLVAGAYWLQITDAQGCSFTRHFNIEQAVEINVPVTPTNATCLQSDGEAIAFGSGGVSPYTYLWSNGATSQTISGLTEGSYTVTVTDANGCSGTGAAYIESTTPITATYTVTASSCTAASGTAALAINGGQAPYTVSWSTSPAQTGITASGLAPGSYAFHITDANGCIRNGSVVIPQQNEINIMLSKTNPNCTAADGAVTAIVSGTGATPYTYQWSNGATSSSISGLAAGYYTVTVTDNDGCAATKATSLESQSPIYVGMATVPVSCQYAQDGSIIANISGGTAPYTYTWSNGLTTGNSLTNIGVGAYTVYVTDANGCTGSAYTYVNNAATSDACYCTITGTVYHDVNGNCVQDAGEAGIENIGIHCQGFGYAYTNASGVYTFHVPGGNYTVSEAVQAIYPLAACQNNSNPVTITAASGCIQTIDFANTVNPLHDIRVNLWNNNQPVPGNSYYQELTVSNDGTVAESLPLAGYKNDGQLGAPTFNPSVVFANPATNWFSSGSAMTTLNPGGIASFNVSYNVPTNIPMGTGLVFYDSAVNVAPMSAWLSDYSPWNNVNTLSQTVVSSYDPNFIEVSPQGLTQEGLIEYKDSILTYRVHFQNSGTYYAQNIFLLNALDENLDWATFKPAGGSHNYTATMDENGMVRFQFDNINLPWEDMSYQASQGYATYTIRMKPGLPLGTKIYNKADIYFDYNEPIVTNETVNTLYKPTSVDNTPSIQKVFSIYPNPAGSSFSILFKELKAGAAKLVVTDIAGKVVMEEMLDLPSGDKLMNMDASQLAAGVYFVTLKGKVYNQTQKLVIVR